MCVTKSMVKLKNVLLNGRWNFDYIYIQYLHKGKVKVKISKVNVKHTIIYYQIISVSQNNHEPKVGSLRYWHLRWIYTKFWFTPNVINYANEPKKNKKKYKQKKNTIGIKFQVDYSLKDIFLCLIWFGTRAILWHIKL